MHAYGIRSRAQTVQNIKRNTLEELEVIASEAALWKKLEGLDAMCKEYGLNSKETTLAALKYVQRPTCKPTPATPSIHRGD